MASDQVSRDLSLTTPFTQGADVKALQKAINTFAGRFRRILHFRVDDDEMLGEETLGGAFRVAHAMGIARPRLDQIERQHVIVQRVQRVIRDPTIRSDAEMRRGTRRRARLREQLDQQLRIADVSLTLTSGPPHWGGSGDVLTQFVEPFMTKRGLPIGSGKRTPAQNAAVGGSANSEHVTTRRTSGARDFPTFVGEDDARALARAMGINDWRPNEFQRFSFSTGGQSFSLQILWGAAIDHGDHVHVGMTRS